MYGVYEKKIEIFELEPNEQVSHFSNPFTQQTTPRMSDQGSFGNLNMRIIGEFSTEFFQTEAWALIKATAEAKRNKWVER